MSCIVVSSCVVIMVVDMDAIILVIMVIMAVVMGVVVWAEHML